MGLQDRKLRRSRRRGTGILYLLYTVIAIAVLGYEAGVIPNFKEIFKTRTPQPTVPEIADGQTKQKSRDSKSKPFILKTDQQGHFRGTVMINNVAMPFLIDTGATKTSIPAKLAVAAGLPIGSSVQSNTAGGRVVDRLTQIRSLKIGNAEIRNLNANINQYLDEVLIGMNTLKYFHMTQSGDTLTLAAIKLIGKDAESVQVLDQSNNRIPNDILAADKPVKKPTVIKKTVTCDENKVCITAYSDR